MIVRWRYSVALPMSRKLAPVIEGSGPRVLAGGQRVVPRRDLLLVPRLALLISVAELTREICDLGGLVLVAHLVECGCKGVHHGAPVVDAAAERVDGVVDELLSRLEILLGLINALSCLVDILLDLLDLPCFLACAGTDTEL